MRKNLTIMLLSLLVLSFTGCNDDDDPKHEQDDELTFVEVGTHDNDKVKLEYYSYDGDCLPKSYHITANLEASEITLKCENSDVVYALHVVSPYVTDKYSFEKDKIYVNEEGKWSATFIDANTIKFTFEALGPDAITDNPPFGLTGCLSMTGEVNGKSAEVSIDVMRYKYFPDWME